MLLSRRVRARMEPKAITLLAALSLARHADGGPRLRQRTLSGRDEMIELEFSAGVYFFLAIVQAQLYIIPESPPFRAD